MSTTTQKIQNGTDCDHRSIDHARYVRAHIEDMAVTTLAPNMTRVDHDGNSYDTDLVNGVCECPDNHYRDEICKHLLKSALVMIYAEGVQTAFVARVARYAAEHGCIVDERGCAGPTTIGKRGFPCPTCVNGVRSPEVDEWTVWKQLCQRTEADR